MSLVYRPSYSSICHLQYWHHGESLVNLITCSESQWCGWMWGLDEWHTNHRPPFNSNWVIEIRQSRRPFCWVQNPPHNFIEGQEIRTVSFMNVSLLQMSTWHPDTWLHSMSFTTPSTVSRKCWGEEICVYKNQAYTSSQWCILSQYILESNGHHNMTSPNITFLQVWLWIWSDLAG